MGIYPILLSPPGNALAWSPVRSTMRMFIFKMPKAHFKNIYFKQRFSLKSMLGGGWAWGESALKKLINCFNQRKSWEGVSAYQGSQIIALPLTSSIQSRASCKNVSKFQNDYLKNGDNNSALMAFI